MLKLSVRTVRNAIHFPYKTHWVFKNEKKTDLIWQRTHLVHKCGYFPFSCSGYLKGSLCTVCKYFQNPSFISLFQVYLCADVTLSRTVSVRYWYSRTRWIIEGIEIHRLLWKRSSMTTYALPLQNSDFVCCSWLTWSCCHIIHITNNLIQHTTMAWLPDWFSEYSEYWVQQHLHRIEPLPCHVIVRSRSIPTFHLWLSAVRILALSLSLVLNWLVKY